MKNSNNTNKTKPKLEPRNSKLRNWELETRSSNKGHTAIRDNTTTEDFKTQRITREQETGGKTS